MPISLPTLMMAVQPKAMGVSNADPTADWPSFYITPGNTIERCPPVHAGPSFKMEEKEYQNYLVFLREAAGWDDFFADGNVIVEGADTEENKLYNSFLIDQADWDDFVAQMK